MHKVDTATKTEYPVDHDNFTGYQQVIKETVYDENCRVKVLYDAAAAILQVHTYEAYGQMLAIHNPIDALVSTGP